MPFIFISFSRTYIYSVVSKDIIITIVLFAHKIQIHIHMPIHEQDKKGYRALTVALNTSYKSISNYINATWYK